MDSKTDGEADEDCLFLEQVLDKLYDFGKCSSLTLASFTNTFRGYSCLKYTVPPV